MFNLQPERRKVNGRTLLTDAFAAAQAALQAQMSAHLNQQLVLAVAHLLGRDAYTRRRQVPRQAEQSGRCCRCHCHRCAHFSRNGYRARRLSCLDYTLEFQLPRVVCQCGGSVGSVCFSVEIWGGAQTS